MAQSVTRDVQVWRLDRRMRMLAWLLAVAATASGCLLMRDPDAIDLAEVGYPLTLAFRTDPKTAGVVTYDVGFESGGLDDTLARGQVTLSEDGVGEAAEALPPGELVMDLTLRGVGTCRVPLSVGSPGVTDLDDLPPLTFDITVAVGTDALTCASTTKS